MLEILEHSLPQYPPRTLHNAGSADLTAAFALDFETRGERLTRKAAAGRYVAISLELDVTTAARQLYTALRRHRAQILNVAGNGIDRLATRGWAQDRLNAHLAAVLALAHQYWPLAKVISGGQTGADLAGVTAAYALAIDAAAMLPKGFLQRDADGRDRQHTEDDIRRQIVDGAATLQLAGRPFA